MSRREVVDSFDLRVHEAEGEPGFWIDALDQVIEITAPHRCQPGSLFAANRPFAKDEGTRPTEAGASTKLIAAALARRQIDLRAEPTSGPLRITARQERHAAERVAVDHRDGTTVGDAIHRVHQISRGHTVHDHPDIVKRISTDRELAVEVVGGRCSGQRLQRPQRIIEHRTTQVLELATVQRRTPGH